MNVKELVFLGDETHSPVLWVCGECGKYTRRKGEAENCCTPIYCSRCGCVSKKSSGFLAPQEVCRDCAKAERDQKAYDKMEKIPEEDMNWKEIPRVMTPGGRFYDGIDDLIETEEEPLPPYVHPCVENSLSKELKVDTVVDVLSEWVVSTVLENLDPDYYDVEDVVFPDEFRKAIQDWADAQFLYWFEPQENMAVLLKSR